MRPVTIAWFFLPLFVVGTEGCGSSQSPPVSAAASEQEADRVLAIAQTLERQGDTKEAFAAYHQIIRNYPGTPSGKIAIERVKKAQSAAGPKPKNTRK
jgi:hypothetical protein